MEAKSLFIYACVCVCVCMCVMGYVSLENPDWYRDYISPLSPNSVLFWEVNVVFHKTICLSEK